MVHAEVVNKPARIPEPLEAPSGLVHVPHEGEVVSHAEQQGPGVGVTGAQHRIHLEDDPAWIAGVNECAVVHHALKHRERTNLQPVTTRGFRNRP